ncbi:hypothetical protein ACE60T_003466 [Salmonella enterica]
MYDAQSIALCMVIDTTFLHQAEGSSKTKGHLSMPETGEHQKQQTPPDGRAPIIKLSDVVTTLNTLHYFLRTAIMFFIIKTGILWKKMKP